MPEEAVATSRQYVVSVDLRPGHEALEVRSHDGQRLDDGESRELARSMLGLSGADEGLLAEVARLEEQATRLERDLVAGHAELRARIVSEVAAYVRHVDRLDEVPGARAAMPEHDPLHSVADAIEARFG